MCAGIYYIFIKKYISNKTENDYIMNSIVSFFFFFMLKLDTQTLTIWLKKNFSLIILGCKFIISVAVLYIICTMLLKKWDTLVLLVVLQYTMWHMELAWNNGTFVCCYVVYKFLFLFVSGGIRIHEENPAYGAGVNGTIAYWVVAMLWIIIFPFFVWFVSGGIGIHEGNRESGNS